VKQKSESDADILLSFDQSNCKVGPNIRVGWLAQIYSGHSIGVGTPHLA